MEGVRVGGVDLAVMLFPVVKSMAEFCTPLFSRQQLQCQKSGGRYCGSTAVAAASTYRCRPVVKEGL